MAYMMQSKEVKISEVVGGITRALAAADGLPIQLSLSFCAFSLASAFLWAGPSSCCRSIASFLKSACRKAKQDPITLRLYIQEPIMETIIYTLLLVRFFLRLP